MTLPTTIPWRLIGAGLAALLVALLVLGGYSYVAGLSETISAQATRIGTLELAEKTATARADALRGRLEDVAAQAARNAQQLDAVATETAEARADAKRVITLFTEHDLGALLNAKPGLLEDRINAASDRARRLLNDATRADGDRSPGGRPAAGGAATPAGPGPR